MTGKLRCGHERAALTNLGNCEACGEASHYIGGDAYSEARALFAAESGVTFGRLNRADDDYDHDGREQRWW